MKTQLTAEESAKLIELGVSPERASIRESSVAYDNGARGIMKVPETPVFTLADLLDILPKEIDNGYNLNIDITEKYYGAAYVCWDDDENWKAVIKDIRFEAIDPELIDTLYSLLVWCLEKGYVKLD